MPFLEAQEHSCTIVERDTDYWTDDSLYSMDKVGSMDDCLKTCRSNSECGAWSWGSARDVPGLTDVCFLKVLNEGEQPKKVAKEGVISGVARSCGSYEKSRPTQRRNSLFCFTLSRPEGHEPLLLQWQFLEKTGIFACDEYAVYSSKEIKIGTGEYSNVINSELDYTTDAQFKEVMSTQAFMTAWTEVIGAGRFLNYDWTVKVDPDTAFFPDRLRRELKKHEDSTSELGVYLSSCNKGLPGALEVFSRDAVKAWGHGASNCTRQFLEQCRGPCPWRENIFIDHCLHDILKVPRKNTSELLSDAKCAPPPKWKSCADSSRAAFHPFKTVESLRVCLDNAKSPTAGNETHAGPVHIRK